jgi:hypothetical protein
MEAPSTPAVEGTQPPPPHLCPIKGRPTLGEDPHTSSSPSLSPHHAHAIALLSRSSTTDAPPPRHLPSLSTSQNRLPVAPSFSPPLGKPPWPGAALILVILAPKILESFTLPFHAFIIHVCFIWIDYVYTSQLGNTAPEPFFEDLQDQALEESQLFFVGQQDKLP